MVRPRLEAPRKVESVAVAIDSRVPVNLAWTDRMRTSAAKMTYELPMTCCQTAQRSSRSAPDGNHHCGAAAKTTRPAIAVASHSRERCRRPRIAKVRSAGTHHTQWCDQEIGEISSAAKALSANAQQYPVAAKACRIPQQVDTNTTAANASQIAVPAVVCGSIPARATTA